MRIVFIGAVDFSAHCLEAVLRWHGNVVGVLTPEVELAKRASDGADLSPIAARWGAPVFRFQRLGDPDVIARVRQWRPDVIFVFGCSQILSHELLQIPPLGCIGTHPALLPRNRGRHPLVWALVEGLTESGLTFFMLDRGVDTGDIVWQRSFPIGEDENAADLYLRITALATEAIGELLTQLAQGALPRRAQDHSQATYWRRRTEADGEIIWSGQAAVAHNLIRALARPYVGAHSFVGENRVSIWRSRLQRQETLSDGVAGEIVARTGAGCVVRCGTGAVELLDWTAPAGVTMSVGTRFAARVRELPASPRCQVGTFR